MFFIKKKEKIKLEIYAPIGQLIDMFPPTLMKNDIPQWYNHIPNIDNQMTVKHCPGFKDLYDNGISIPLWADYLVEMGANNIKNITWPQRSYGAGAMKHPLPTQAPGAWPDYFNIKFESPWRFWCPEPIPFVFVQPVWNQEDPQQFTVVPGVTEFRYQNQIHINTLWKPNGISKEVLLKAGNTMAQLIPLSNERPIDISYHIMTESIYKEKFTLWDYTLGKASYLKLRSIISKKKN